MKPRQRFLILCALLACAGQTSAAPSSPEQIERGRYLVASADCISCHSTKDGASYAGGRAIETPFGIVYSRNLTPDRETGLGSWSDADFYRTLHEGLSKDGSHLYPAFPYTYFTRIEREDALAMKAFLDTLKPVRNVIPPNRLMWPLNQRWLMALWNSLFFSPGPAEQPVPERGAYLVDALGHCGACHTPKNLLGADRSDAVLHGGVIQNWLAPNNTGDVRSGLGNWSEDDIVEYLQSGRNTHALAGGPMAEVIENSTSQLNGADLHAMARYLKRLPGAGLDSGAVQADPTVISMGEAIYIDSCTGCHLSTGLAAPRAFPPLKGSAVVQSSDPVTVIRLVLQGARVATTGLRPTPFAMPGFGWKLNDTQVAALATYIRTAWGNAAAPVQPEQVARLRKKLESGPALP